MTDADRIIKSVRDGARMLGPSERQRCEKHPTRWVTYRWVWNVPEGDETHEDMLASSSEPQTIRPCSVCEAEAERELAALIRE
jgi:hypothetical protein